MESGAILKENGVEKKRFVGVGDDKIIQVIRAESCSHDKKRKNTSHTINKLIA